MLIYAHITGLQVQVGCDDLLRHFVWSIAFEIKQS